ncbi:C2H2 zinc finger [Ceratobasidium sp. AG-Ba]|nr:C2H2 zinc finger [Ceratobasidium sp. AG-Ba]
MSQASQTASTGKAAPSAESGANSDSDDANNDNPQTSEKVLGKRRAPPEAVPETQDEEESLSDADADWEPEDDVNPDQPTAMEASAPKFARLTLEPEEESSGQRASPQPGPSTRGARGIKPVRRRTPRTRASGKEGSPGLDSLPYEAPSFTCNWRPLQHPNDPPCLESCTRLSDLRRHQRPHFEIDLEYAKEHLDEEAVAKAQAAIDKCAGRGQSFACEVCGKVYSRLDAVARHRQQPQGRRCNMIYKQRRAADKRAQVYQGAESKDETEQAEDKDEEAEEENDEE